MLSLLIFFHTAIFFSFVPLVGLDSISHFFATNCYHFISQVTAVHPVGEGQCIALGYESALPLVLLTLQGGDIKPYEFPNEGTKAMAGTGMITKLTITTSIFLNVNTNIKTL